MRPPSLTKQLHHKSQNSAIFLILEATWNLAWRLSRQETGYHANALLRTLNSYRAHMRTISFQCVEVSGLHFIILTTYTRVNAPRDSVCLSPWSFVFFRSISPAINFHRELHNRKYLFAIEHALPFTVKWQVLLFLFYWYLRLGQNMTKTYHAR